MPIIFLSPSTQDHNPYVTGSGSEEYWMNQIADAMEPYLRSSGIRFRRNDPGASAAAAIAQANSGYYDFYLALHSNAIGNGAPQTTSRGIIAFYYPSSQAGKRGAEAVAEALKTIYPLPQRVTTQPTTALGEVARSRFPAVLAEIGYHDNVADARWVEGHVEPIAQQLVRAMTNYFGLPFIAPMTPQTGTVRLNYGTLNLRAAPSPSGTIIGNLPNGASVTIYGAWQGWYVVHYRDQVGYAAAAYIDT